MKLVIRIIFLKLHFIAFFLSWIHLRPKSKIHYKIVMIDIDGAQWIHYTCLIVRIQFTTCLFSQVISNVIVIRLVLLASM